MTAFFDTNILLYAQEDNVKADTARSLLNAGGTISVQVLNEFASVSHRKLGRSWPEIEEAVEDALSLVATPVPVTLSTANTARSLAASHGFAFYDALIVAAALEAGCDTLFTEDLQHGRRIGGLSIINPFVEQAS